MKKLLLCLILASSVLSGEKYQILCAQNADLVIPPFRQAPERKAQFPLKTERMIFTDSLVLLAHENIRQYPAARLMKEKIVQAADVMAALTDDELAVLMTDARVPRAFELSAKGCPVHGDSVFNVGGRSAWTVDLKHPFQVKCPIDGQVFPSNDYAAYYQSGFTEQKDWDTSYTDDGFGWTAPDGERYWFVAYANQQTWAKVINGIGDLSKAYMLTGEHRYASQAAYMLYCMATVYPSMNHEEQSRYGLMMKSRGVRYPGKITNHIQETGVIEQVAEAYDMVWQTIDADQSLQKRTGMTGVELRAFIEANLLEDGLDALEQDKILGNTGMHQSAMLSLHLARQHAGMEQAVDKMLHEPAPHAYRNGMYQGYKNGLEYTVYNQIFRDGIPLESPAYNVGWLGRFMVIADKLSGNAKELFTGFRFKQILDGFLNMVAIGRYTPDFGDSGSVLGGLIAQTSAIYHPAYDTFHDPRYLSWLNLPEEKSFNSFQSLFRRPLPASEAPENNRAVDVQPSRLFAGYGFGILNNRSDATAVAFSYNTHYAHYHWDYLNIELFAGGQKMMPDLGYPDAANAFVAGRYTWSSNTVSHNTVVVDRKRQQQQLPGALHDFTDGGFARTMDASYPAYTNTTEYRRNVIMVDVEDGQSYLVDFFNVCGGTRHDYSLHGPPGKTSYAVDEWSDVMPGTYAGPTVPYGYLYDNEKLQREGPEIGYGAYEGSGFQNLFNVRQLKSGNGLVEYRHVNDEDARLRIFPLSAEGQEIHIADAYDKPRAKDNVLKYMICSRSSDGGAPLKSTFVSVLEPFKGENHILTDAQITKPDQGAGHVVAVKRGDYTDIILYDPSASMKKLNRYGLQTDAVSVVATFDKSGKLARVFFSCGSFLHCQNRKFTATPVKGEVVAIDIPDRTFQVVLDDSEAIPAKDFSGCIAHFTNALRTTVHPLSLAGITDKKMDAKVKDDLLIGRFRVDEVEGNVVTTHTTLPFHQHYAGATILDNGFRPLALFQQYNNEKITLMEPVAAPLERGDEVWICNIGMGDRFLIKPFLSWTRE